MSFYQELPYPVFVGTGSVATTGSTDSLQPGQVALVNADTYQILGAGASIASNPRVLIAGGSWHTQDSLSKFIGGLKQSVKTQDFKATDVIEFHRSYPNPLAQDIIQIGWDGVNPYNSLSFDCGQSYFFKINVSGEDVFRTYSRPLYRFIELRTDCCPGVGNCNTTCNDQVDPTYYAKILANLINSDVELQYFVKAEAVVSNYATTTPTHYVWNLTVCDNGDVVALASVQAQYPTLTVTRISRVTSTSTYQMVSLITNGTPAAFQPTASILLAVCGVCPSGYTTVAAYDYYLVRRPLAGTENLAGGTATFTNAVGTDYSAHAQTFLGSDGKIGIVQISVASGTTVTALKDDILTFSHTNQASCTPSSPSTVAWVNVQSQYLPTQPIYLTLEKTCGGSNQLTALQAFYANDPTLVADSVSVLQSGTCADTYTATQYATFPVVDDCLSPAPVLPSAPLFQIEFNSSIPYSNTVEQPLPYFPNVQSFNGFQWSTTPPSGVVAGDTYPNSPVYAGVRITGAYVDTRFGNCSFQPTDYYSVRPLRIRVSQVDSDGNPCSSVAEPTIFQYGSVATQTGEWLIRQYLKANSLEAYNIWSNDPRIRDIYDQQALSFIDRKQLYKVYYIVYTEDRFKANWNISQPNDKFETIIAFPVGVDTTAFENLFSGFFSQAGVTLTERDI